MRTIDASVRAIVFSRDMKAGDVVKAAVAKAGPDFFDRNSAVYVVDVKGMPAIIRTLFAMPAMRRRPYKLLVDVDGAKTADIPGGATYPTVIVLEKLRLMSVQYPTTADELIPMIEPEAAKTE
jgi:NADPH-dependent ferric siderophore reductase